jgi:ADP-ribose pyrophosphatase YjhB (NUDIX family)
MPGGKTEFRERLVDTAIRELFEETAIKVKETDLEFLCVQDDIEKDAHFVTIGFLAKKWKGEAQICEPDKITEWKWWNIKKLPKPMYKPSEKMTKTYLKSRSLK